MFIISNSIQILTVPKIFSIMEARGIIRTASMLVVMGISLFFEMKVVMGRVAMTMNIKEISMINI